MTVNNPFIVAGKIPDEYFCDRRAESQRLVREITNGNNLVIISPRRMGKTGLIQHCFGFKEIAEQYNTFYVDILQTSGLKEFTYLLGREIFRQLAPLGERYQKKFVGLLRSISGSFGFDPITGMPTFDLQLGDISRPEITLEEIFRYLSESERPSIVAIDEFQQIANYREDKNVEALLRAHIQRISNANFIFAGSERHSLQQMFTESARPFFNSASLMELKAIDYDEYVRFATSLFRERERSLAPEAIEIVYKTVEGNTFYLQKVFNLAFSMTERGGECKSETVKNAFAEILASYDTLYREALSQVTEPQKQLLLAIAKDGFAEGITSAHFIRRNVLASASSVQSAMKKLTERGLVIHMNRRYYVQDPMLRLWLLLTYGSVILEDILNRVLVVNS